MSDLLEIIMLLSFGASWPLNLIKSYKARTAKGTSIYFYILLEVGYLAGIVRKFIDDVDYVVIFYFINFALILMCILVYFRNRKLDERAKLYR